MQEITVIVCAEEAKFGDAHSRWGIHPSWGMSQRLPRRVGVMRELSYTARTFSGVEAAAMGLANETVPAAELDASVAALTHRPAQRREPHGCSCFMQSPPERTHVKQHCDAARA